MLSENDYPIFNPKSVRIYQPPSNSHKGQNGKLLVIGGSELFHSSIFWSADVASKIVDLVHLTSPANENNQIFRKKLKEKFWNGIVVDWKDVEGYIEEDDCVLIGPGMTRGDGKTKKIVNYLLKKYPNKRWVIDGGALQEVDVRLITESCILTPHRKEFGIIDKQINRQIDNPIVRFSGNQIVRLSKQLNGCTILLKGPVDTVCQGDRCTQVYGGPPSLANRLQELFVHGSWRATRRAGNPGMTKGGTGDVLAGLTAALYCKNGAWTAATMASYINKKAGESLYKRVGPYFNSADLVREVPLTIYGIMKKNVST